MDTNRKHPFFWVALLLSAIFASLYFYAATVIYQYGELSKDLGWEYGFADGKCLVLAVDPKGSAAGKLKKGDQVLNINGNPPVSESHVMHLTTLSFPGEFYNVRVNRNGTEIDVPLRAKIEKGSGHFAHVLIPFFASLVMFLIAIVIGLAKPEEGSAQLFTVTWCSVALIFLAVGLEPIRDLFAKPESNFHTLIWLLSFSPIVAATAYHFCYRFPPGIAESKFWSRIRDLFYVWAGLLTLVYAAIRIAILYDAGGVMSFFSIRPALGSVLERSSDALMAISLLAMTALVVRNHFRIREINERRRLRWVAVGTLVGIFPSLIFFAAKSTFASFQLNSSFTTECLNSMMLASDLFIVLVPLSIGYAIFKHRIFDIHVVVRQGLRYLLAKNVLRIFTYLPAIIIVHAIIKNRDQSISQLLFSNTTYIVMTVAALIGLKFRNQFADWLDRKFFREAYNSEKILVSVIDEVKNINSMSEISKWVTLQLDAALHPKQVFVFYRKTEKGDFALGYSSGEHSPDLRIPSDSGLQRVFTYTAGAQTFPSKETMQLPEQEQEWLHQLGTHLIVPMQDSDHKLVGMLLLGEKKSEEPYTASDRKLLEALAGQISILCENLLLKEHVDHEFKIKRDVLARLNGENRNILKECPTCGKCYDSSANVCEQDQKELILTLPVDRIIDDKYLLNKLLGRGGMGAVYQATDLRLNREIAIKILIGSMFGDRMALKRFDREARASAQLNHPNVVSVYDFGGIQGEGAYLVMELIYGFTLRFYLNQKGTVPPALAADWFNQILEGMKAAHQAGIVHRDLKPENILITKKDGNESSVKILDFGLAKMRFLDSTESKNLTAPGTIVGTLSYMSPEQIVGSEVDERTDIFSLGVMAIEALTGKPPFTGQTSSDIALAILSRAFELQGDAPEIRVLNSIFQKTIAKDPKKRYSSLAELHEELIGAMKKCPPFPSSIADKLEMGSHVQTRITV